tara:strand:+ start:1175 stop:1438 length:264 start_codon:yes stop_codon:yes gene_type:complete
MLLSKVVTNANSKKGRLNTRINPTPTSAKIGLDEPISPSPAAKLANITPIQASIWKYMSPNVNLQYTEYFVELLITSKVNNEVILFR